MTQKTFTETLCTYFPWKLEFSLGKEYLYIFYVFKPNKE